MRQSGQTLIELVISIAFVLILITAVTILTINGLKNSQFSQNQIQAAKLAQEGVEKMRTLRDKDYSVCGNSTSSNTLLTNGLWDISCTSGCNYVLQTQGATNPFPYSCASTPITDPFYIFYTSGNQTEKITIGNLVFKRLISIKDSRDINNVVTTFVKEINVTVTWTDASGTHNSNITTKLSKN